MVEFTRVNSDSNGNPRYVCHFFEMLTKKELLNTKWAYKAYDIACKRANKIGGRKYRGKEYEGGIVFASYSLPGTEKHIKRIMDEVVKAETKITLKEGV